MLTASMEGAAQPTLVKQILASAKYLSRVRFVFTKHEVNTMADHLTKTCTHSDKDIRIIYVLNSIISNLLFKYLCNSNTS